MQKKFCTLLIVLFSLVCAIAKADVEQLKVEADAKATAAAQAHDAAQNAEEALQEAKQASQKAKEDLDNAQRAFDTAEEAVTQAIDDESLRLQKLEDAEAEVTAKNDEVARLADVFRMTGTDADRDALTQAAVDASDAKKRRDAAQTAHDAAKQRIFAADRQLGTAQSNLQHRKFKSEMHNQGMA